MNRLIAIFFALVAMIFIAMQNLSRDDYYYGDNWFENYLNTFLNIDIDGEPNYDNDLYKFNRNDTLTIAIEKDAPGFFLYNGEYYGYINAIFGAYSNSIGKVLRVITCDSQRELIKQINSDSVAFGVSMSTDKGINEDSQSFLKIPISDSAKYVIIGNKKNKNINTQSIPELIDSSKILFKRGAKEIDMLSEKAYEYLRDTASVKFKTTREYISLLRDFQYDFIVCKEIEANMYCYNYKNVILTHTLDQWVYSFTITNFRNKTLYREFCLWLNEFKETDNYAEIVNYYQKDGYMKNFLKDGFLNPIKSISHYDDIFRKRSKNTPYDWRFLAAIGYVESKFNPFDTSHKGAIGIMQVTMRTGRHYGITTEEELRQPKTNISIAIKLLNENRRMLKLSKEFSTNNMQILLASYNAGYGHISDAMRLAKKNNENPKLWSVVKKYLKLKKEPEYYNQIDAVKSGSFASQETEIFVDKVMEKYKEYVVIQDK